MDKNLEWILNTIDNRLGSAFEINVYGEENIVPGKAVYCGNHFHFLDPIFASYPVAKNTERLIHAMAKPSLFKLPVIGNYLRKSGAIKTPRIKKEGHKAVKGALDEMSKDISSFLSSDEPIYIAYTGTRTKHYPLDMREAEKDSTVMGIMSLLKKYDRSLDLEIVPVAVETYKRDSKFYFIYGLAALLGLLHPREKSPIDVMYGKPIHIGEFLSKGKNKKELFDYIVDSVYDMREKLHEMHSGDYRRDISRYGRPEI